MKRIAALIALLPVSAMAHGAHAPVPESSHGLAHLAPALLVVAVAVVVARISLRRKDDA